ncbi:TPA: hypothetical protein DEP58_01980 [Patescibacteria group bacterium]|nr:MAG: hypothetical protein UU98_C0004G0001 [Parcubacteria group bacterium GW2011_GWD2_42_14]HCC05055.1 hypothetical protein [Patescibacteria group bacterium]
MKKKTQEQLLKEALELITRIDGFKDSCVPRIMQLMVSKQFVDAGEPVTEGMVVVGDRMSDYQKALATLVEDTCVQHDQLTARLQIEGEPSPNDAKILANLKEEHTSLRSLFWKAIFKTHDTFLTPTASTVLVKVEGFRIAEQQVPRCPHCGERHFEDE